MNKANNIKLTPDDMTQYLNENSWIWNNFEVPVSKMTGGKIKLTLNKAPKLLCLSKEPYSYIQYK